MKFYDTLLLAFLATASIAATLFSIIGAVVFTLALMRHGYEDVLYFYGLSVLVAFGLAKLRRLV